MRKPLLAAFAAATILSAAPFSTSAVAMPLMAPSTLGAARADAALMRVAVLCGSSGCAPVHVSKIKRPPPGFITKAAPLVFPMPNRAQAPNAPQEPVASK
jgi:hypothetical protein